MPPKPLASSSPGAGQSQTAEAAAHPPQLREIREGKAIITAPPKQKQDDSDDSDENSSNVIASSSASSAAVGNDGDVVAEDGQLVFYNKVQVFNRDLSVLMIQTFIDDRKREYEEKLRLNREKEERRKKWQEEKAAKAAAAAAAASGPLTEPVAASAAATSPSPTPTPSTEATAPSSTSTSSSISSSSSSSSFPGVTIIEALSATGLRSIRYFKELTDVRQIIVNDCSADAVRSIEYNIKMNGLTTEQLLPSHNDAITLMQKYRTPITGPVIHPRPQVIDLDPYGTASPFLDSAVQAVDDGGLLAVTCTDKAILCGNHSEACYAKYGSMPLKGPFCHELAVRIVLNAISTAANRYGRYIVPMLSMSIDFYVRMFVRVYTSPAQVKRQASLHGMVLMCSGCHSFWPHHIGRIQEQGNSVKYSPGQMDAPLHAGCRCPECGGHIKMGGPFWLGPMHNKAFVRRALASVQASPPERFATSQRIIGSLTLCSEELQYGYDNEEEETQHVKDLRKKSKVSPLPTPTEHSSILFYSLSHIFQMVNSSCPKISVIRSALLNAGYRVGQTHAFPHGLKTTAPPSVIWDIVRCYLEEHPPVHPPKKNTPGERILGKEATLRANFTHVPGTDMSSQATGVAKFLPNPEEHWGPKARAGKRKASQPEEQVKRAKLNQNRRSRFRACKLFAESGACRYGDNCKYAHIVGTKPGEDVTEQVLAKEKEEAAAKAKTDGNDMTDTVAATAVAGGEEKKEGSETTTMQE